MSYNDRMDREFANSVREDMLTERLDNFSKQGPLLNDKVRGALEFKIGEETRLPAGVVSHIVDTINGTVGHTVPSAAEQTREQTLHEIKSAFGDHVTNPRFLDRIAGEIVKIVENSIEDREKRIVESKMAPAAPAASAPTVSAPAIGGKT